MLNQISVTPLERTERQRTWEFRRTCSTASDQIPEERSLACVQPCIKCFRRGVAVPIQDGEANAIVVQTSPQSVTRRPRQVGLGRPWMLHATLPQRAQHADVSVGEHTFELTQLCCERAVGNLPDVRINTTEDSTAPWNFCVEQNQQSPDKRGDKVQAAVVVLRQEGHHWPANIR